ncbi:MAG: 30S ribosomal protein S17 [uncultured bacterium]|nr:MAG: 30S ribosomal protein S17 [uncultured bacterium]
MMHSQKVSGRTVVGKVISNKMDKTIVVEVERKVKHPLYGKYMRKFSRMYAHDSDNLCHIGDLVLIKMCRPISKTKSWMLVEVVNQAEKEVTK